MAEGRRNSTTGARESYEAFIPAPGSIQERMIDRGSGIVGSRNDATGRVLIDYEGNRIRTANLVSYADRVHHAAGRRLANYPTVACAYVSADVMIRVGDYDWERGIVSLDGPEIELQLARWLDCTQLDPAELQTRGNGTTIRGAKSCVQLLIRQRASTAAGSPGITRSTCSSWLEG
jgi:hypothetical protein